MGGLQKLGVWNNALWSALKTKKSWQKLSGKLNGILLGSHAIFTFLIFQSKIIL